MIEQCHGLTGTDIDARSKEFLLATKDRFDRVGSTAWMSELQIKWLTDVWNRHFA